MATIRKRGNKYQVQIRRACSKSTTKSFHKKSDALEWARTMEIKADRYDLPVSTKELSQITLGRIIERYRDEVTPKKKGCEAETFILNALLRTKISKLKLSQLSIADFIKHREKRLETVKAGTANRDISLIRHALDIAKNEWGYPLPENPLKGVKKLKVNDARNRRLEEGELDAIKHASLKTRNKYILPMILFAVETAMRRGEILGIKRSHIDFEKRTLLIPVTKNGHSRIIPLSKIALQILEETGGVIPFPISASSVRMAWDRLIARAGIEDLHFHDLRHEAISHFFEKGLSIPETALISGHRDYSMLARYTHLRAEDIVSKI